jgi:putative endonuclease
VAACLPVGRFESAPGHQSQVLMFIVYAISSISRNYIYVGLTDNIERRLSEHNNGYNKTTKPYTPFRLIVTESFPTRIEARAREKYLKSGIGKEYLKNKLISMI